MYGSGGEGEGGGGEGEGGGGEGEGGGGEGGGDACAQLSTTGLPSGPKAG